MEVTLRSILPGRVSAGPGLLGVNIQSLGEIATLICTFWLRETVCAHCLNRSVPKIHLHVAGALSNQHTTSINNSYSTAADNSHHRHDHHSHHHPITITATTQAMTDMPILGNVYFLLRHHHRRCRVTRSKVGQLELHSATMLCQQPPPPPPSFSQTMVRESKICAHFLGNVPTDLDQIYILVIC